MSPREQTFDVRKQKFDVGNDKLLNKFFDVKLPSHEMKLWRHFSSALFPFATIFSTSLSKRKS